MFCFLATVLKANQCRQRRIANGEHPHLKIREGDTVVFPANLGNTISVVNTIDRLMMQALR